MSNQWAHDGTCHMGKCPNVPTRTVTMSHGVHTVTKDLCDEHHSLAHRIHEQKISTLRDCQPYFHNA